MSETENKTTGVVARKDWGAFCRMDMHCHSWASDGPVNKAVGVIGCPESYSPPERVFDQAMARGMDLVTITDHDTIRGAMELADRGFERFVVGEEVSVVFPEDRCLFHVLVWGISPEQHEQIEKLNLRDDIYAFAAWVREQNLAHSCAHPLYMQNGRLTRWHIERVALLFKCFEVRNGAHANMQNRATERFVEGLTPGLVHRLVDEHGIEPLWPRIWEKGRTGGSDDHALLNIGKTWTAIPLATGERIDEPGAFLRQVMAGQSRSGGVGGHSALLAHQLATVGAHYYADRLHEQQSPSGRYLGSKLLKFAGVHADRPSKLRVAAYKATRRMWLPRHKTRGLPITKALRNEVYPLLEKYPQLRDRLDPETWTSGAALSEHEQMAAFTQELTEALGRAMTPGLVRSFRKRDPARISEHLISYAMLQLAQVPYMISLFHQNKERNLVEQFEHETNKAGSKISVVERPMRVSLFTDTIADINGVCRFIQNVAQRAHESDRDMQVITSTRLEVPDLPNIYNFDPVFAIKMPKYENLDLCLPPLMRILRHIDEHQPDVIHISTPGPVGCIGFLAAKMLRIPVLGVYHTDFPAYIDRLFDEHGLTQLSESFMRGFYRPFTAIFTRSEDYVRSLGELGLRKKSIVSLMPGFDTEQFNPGYADRTIWRELGARAASVKVLYVGRVSVEKNMPQLTEVWKSVHAVCRARGLDAELIVVGDGPYRAEMEKTLRGRDAVFLGFRHGQELSAIYASSDMFAFPSTTDTLGQVVMESQGSGLAVIVTDEGGPKEVVDDGQTGFVIPADDVDLWSARIVELIADAQRRRAMGAAAFEAMQQYSLVNSFEHFWEVHTRAWQDHLKSLGVCPETAGVCGQSNRSDDESPQRTPTEQG
jgi:glycosyltransferase involved in cell wall biosynthesis/predicted metal-dependent phosphoesterase TrpH